MPLASYDPEQRAEDERAPIMLDLDATNVFALKLDGVAKSRNEADRFVGDDHPTPRRRTVRGKANERSAECALHGAIMMALAMSAAASGACRRWRRFRQDSRSDEPGASFLC